MSDHINDDNFVSDLYEEMGKLRRPKDIANLPAFPFVDPSGTYETCWGMTLRTRIAESAMNGLLSNPAYADYSPESTAKSALSYADALIAELLKQQQ